MNTVKARSCLDLNFIVFAGVVAGRKDIDIAYRFETPLLPEEVSMLASCWYRCKDCQRLSGVSQIQVTKADTVAGFGVSTRQLEI